MTDPFDGSRPAAAWAAPDGVVMLVEDGAFCLSAASGDITGGALGLFHGDVRLLSRWVVLIDGAPVEPLSVQSGEPYAATFIGRAGGLVVLRHRTVSAGMTEEIALRNPGPDQADVTVTIDVATDFAPVFAVKAGEPHDPGPLRISHDSHQWTVASPRHRTVITADPESTALTFHAAIPPRGEWHLRLEAGTATLPSQSGAASPAGTPGAAPPGGTPGAAPPGGTPGAAPPGGTPGAASPADPLGAGPTAGMAAPAERAARWRSRCASITATDPALAATLERSIADLGSLRIGDTIAAGAPWYLALFGRDALLTSWMALPLDPGLALGSLRALAAHQGTTTDPATEEEPGRIPHEIRSEWGAGSRLTGAYYGTADATPLFVMLLGELYRRGHTAPDLTPAADRALDWIGRHIARHEFVSYRPGGLANQGWKDSPDAISWPDGTLVEPPIALCEVQAYVYGAYRARAVIARAHGDDARPWEDRATSFRQTFHQRFWRDGRLALALDGTCHAVDTVASNQAHCLWTGILDEAPARAVAADLAGLFTGWGLRTLSPHAARYDPLSYHNGSVWPHDTAIAVAGLARYGFTADAVRIAGGLLAAARAFDGRLPEVFAGFDRDEFAAPVPYPSSCAPQAWAAAAPLMLVTALSGAGHPWDTVQIG